MSPESERQKRERAARAERERKSGAKTTKRGRATQKQIRPSDQAEASLEGEARRIMRRNQGKR